MMERSEAHYSQGGERQGFVLGPEDMERSMDIYSRLQSERSGAVKIGLFDEDLEAVYAHPETVMLVVHDISDEPVYLPLMTPASVLPWRNMDLAKSLYGDETEFYIFTHPPIEINGDPAEEVTDLVRQKLDQGVVLFADQYRGEPTPIDNVVQQLGSEYKLESLGGEETKRETQVYVGTVDFEGVQGVHESATIYDVYTDMVERGDVVDGADNGVSIAPTITGEEAARVWQIYKNPFDKLSESHPEQAGFGEEELLGILADPDVVKIVNRVDGVISTLCIFVQDFDHCPWFSKEYFARNYSRHYDTDNILIFPGIVSDENMRGENYSLDIIDLAAKLLKRRGSQVLVTFECTEISATYIPALVTAAVEHSGVARVSGLEESIQAIDYKTLRKIS